MKFLLKIVFIIIIFLPFGLKAGINDSYIQKKKNTFRKWSKDFKYVEGHIYLENDTQLVQLMEFKGKEKRNYNLFCVLKSSEDSIKFLSSKDIEGFNVGSEYFEKNELMNESFFMQRVSNGNIELFVKKSIPSDTRYLFFFKKRSEYSYFVLNPLESNITYFDIRSSGTGSMLIEVETKLLGESFKKFVNMQMGDCTEVRNMVKAEFYKMEDLEHIVNVYNACFQNIKNPK